MDTLHKALAIGVVVLTLALGYAAKVWSDERMARAVADQQNHDTQVLVAAQQKVQELADAKLKASLEAQQADFDKKMSSLQGQLDYFRESVANIKGLKTPIQITMPAPTAENPHPDVMVSVPQEDLAAIDAQLKELSDLQQKFPVCQSDLAAEKLKTASLQKDVESQRTALKGGTFWHRVGHDAKVVAVTVGGLVIAMAITGHLK